MDETLFQDMAHIDDIPFLGGILRLHWAFCPHVSFIDLFISLEQYFLLVSFGEFGKLCNYVRTL